MTWWEIWVKRPRAATQAFESDSEQAQFPEIVGQVQRQAVGRVVAGQVAWCVGGLEVAPALVRAPRLGFGAHPFVAEDEVTAPHAVSINNAFDGDYGLAYPDETLDDPVERAAVENLGGAARGMAGAVHQARLAALAPGFVQAGGVRPFELFDVVDTNTHFEQI